MRHLLQQSHLSAVAAASPGVHTDTFLILAAVLCFLLCVVGLAFVARCWRLCNPSAYSVDPAAAEPEAMPAACGGATKGLKKKALQALPTVSFGTEDEAAECAICLAEFARGDGVRVLPPCAHRFHAACVDVWLMSSSTCPSCRRALVVAAAGPPTCCATAAAQASTTERHVAGERGPCRPSSVR